MSEKFKTDRKNRHKPGTKWRLGCDHKSGVKLDVSNETHPGYEFDEIVADDWLHAERMDRNQWWIRLGEQTFWVTVSSNPKVPSEIRPQ